MFSNKIVKLKCISAVLASIAIFLLLNVQVENDDSISNTMIMLSCFSLYMWILYVLCGLAADWLQQLAGRANMGQQGSQPFPALEEKVMAFIRGKKMKVDDILTVGNSFRLSFSQSLNPLEQSQLDACVQSMQDKGLLTENLALTEAGFLAAYS